MAEERLRSGGENRRQAFAVWRDASVPDGENPSIETMQSASPYGTVNCALGKTQWTLQLPDRDDTMLPFRQIRQ